MKRKVYKLWKLKSSQSFIKTNYIWIFERLSLLIQQLKQSHFFIAFEGDSNKKYSILESKKVTDIFVDKCKHYDKLNELSIKIKEKINLKQKL